LLGPSVFSRRWGGEPKFSGLEGQMAKAGQGCFGGAGGLAPRLPNFCYARARLSVPFGGPTMESFGEPFAGHRDSGECGALRLRCRKRALRARQSFFGWPAGARLFRGGRLPGFIGFFLGEAQVGSGNSRGHLGAEADFSFQGVGGAGHRVFRSAGAADKNFRPGAGVRKLHYVFWEQLLLQGCGRSAG